MYTTREALIYLQQKHSKLQLSLDTFYHALHRRNIPRSSVASKHDPNKMLSRYYLTQEQLDSLSFRSTSRNTAKNINTNPIVKIYNTNDIHELEKIYGLLLTSDGVQEALQNTTNVQYGPNNVRNMHRTGMLRIVGSIGRTYLYPAIDLENIKLHPNRVKRVDIED